MAGAEVSNQLTYIAEACLGAALKLAWRDLVARYGGEEFAVVLSGVDSGQALAVAERIRRQVALAESGQHRVTVSIGVAQYRPSGGDDAEQLLSRADQALYAAKHGGRNRVQASRPT